MARQELAIEAVRAKYGRLLYSIAEKLTGSKSDAEEVLNDTLMRLWQNIPPANPQNLRAYACKTARNAAFKQLEYNLAQKRNCGSELFLDELEAVLPDKDSGRPFENIDLKLLLDGFLRGMRPLHRAIFLKRYFFFDSVPEIAADLGITRARVTSILFRARKKLKETVYAKGEESK